MPGLVDDMQRRRRTEGHRLGMRNTPPADAVVDSAKPPPRVRDGQDPVADRDALDTVADRFDHARDLGSGCGT